MRLKIHIILSVFFCLLFFSCQQKKKEGAQTVSYRYSLQETGQTLSYENDKPMKYGISSVFPFTDKNGRKYLTFREYDQNEIQIYEMYTGNHYKTVNIAMEGPNGIGHLAGYYIKNFDEIYLNNAMLPFIARSDTSGHIFQKISFEKSDEGLVLVPIFTTGIFYTPLVIIKDTFYVAQGTSMPGKEPDTWPVSCYIDTTHKRVKTLPLCFPPILKANELRKVGLGLELVYSRCFDGFRFVYSFYFEEAITVASPDHLDVQKIPAKSKYINRLNPREKRPDDMFLGAKRECEAPFYGNLIHDPYRNVYYRVAYPETEMEELDGRAYIDIFITGRKRFSIIVLDKDFNIIGETLFPDYKYCSTSMFVEKEGLYIRNNHFKSPDFDEDKLMFTCLKLIKE
ncbi:hypothetical protein AGMMS50239_38850 [Bacteroidia bacterium]|nr:hypothetical protein AGMMS50239_38850 [Bacteroidia bacterium]